MVMRRPPSRCGTISASPTAARRRAPRCRRAVRRPSLRAPPPCRRRRRGPSAVRRTNEVRRSPLRCARATKPSDTSRSTMPVTLPFDTMQEARHLAHQHAVGLAVERRHHVEARQRGVELRLQPLAQLTPSIKRRCAQQPDPQPQPLLAVGAAARSRRAARSPCLASRDRDRLAGDRAAACWHSHSTASRHLLAAG